MTNPFIPQVEPYNASKDILNAFMMDYNMKLQRESQVMDLMKQLDPVQLMGDKLQVAQYDKINEIEDYVTKLMKSKNGRLSSEDLFNIQYQISGVERWQNDRLSEFNTYKEEKALYANNIDEFDNDYFNMTELNFINGGIFPGNKSFLKVMSINFEEFLMNAEPLTENDKWTDEQPVFDESGKVVSTKQVVGYGDRNSVGALNQRGKWFLGQYMKSPALREGVKNAFYDDKFTTPKERQGYIDKALTMNTDGMVVDDPVTGAKKSAKVTPEYLWGMNYAPSRIQPSTTNVVRPKTLPKFMQPPTGEGAEKDKELLPVELSSGENAKYEMEQKFGTHEKQKKVEVTFVPEKIEQPSNKVITVGGGGGARKLTVRNDMLIAEEYALGTSVGDANKSGISSGMVAGTGYNLTQVPQVERRIKTYMGDTVELQDVGIEELGGKKYFKGETEAKSRRTVKFSKGMKISEQLYKRLEDMVANGEEPEKSQAKIILDQIKRADIVNWSVLYGSQVKGETMVLSELFTPELAKEFNMEYILPEDIGQTAEEPKEESTIESSTNKWSQWQR